MSDSESDEEAFESLMSEKLIKSQYGIYIPNYGRYIGDYGYSYYGHQNQHIPAPEKSNGIICLINMYKDRQGSEKDVAALINMSQELNFELFEEPANSSRLVKRTVHFDLNEGEIFELVRRFSRYKLKETRIPRILVLMCHGNEGGMQDGSGFSFKFHDTILHHFNSLENPPLANILKLIIVQSCQGKRSIPHFDSGGRQQNQTYFSNLLVCQSSMDGFKSLRTLDNGSPYIQTFCEIMLKSWNTRNKSIIEIFNELHQKVKKFESSGTNYALVPVLKMIGALDTKYFKKSLSDICPKIKRLDQMRILLRKSVVESSFNKVTSEEMEKIKNFIYYGSEENPYLRPLVPYSELLSSSNSVSDVSNTEATQPMVTTLKLSEYEENDRLVELRIQMDYSTKLAVFQKHDTANNCQVWEKQVETNRSPLTPSNGYLLPSLLPSAVNSSNNGNQQGGASLYGNFVSGMGNAL